MSEKIVIKFFCHYFQSNILLAKTTNWQLYTSIYGGFNVFGTSVSLLGKEPLQIMLIEASGLATDDEKKEFTIYNKHQSWMLDKKKLRKIAWNRTQNLPYGMLVVSKIFFFLFAVKKRIYCVRWKFGSC